MYFMYHGQILPSLPPLLRKKQKERQKKKLKGKRAKFMTVRLVEGRMWGERRRALWAVKDMPSGDAVQVSQPLASLFSYTDLGF